MPNLPTSNQSYCVQYMGINDDKLEVLTRRVLIGKLELEDDIDPKAMRKIERRKHHRPARLDPLPKVRKARTKKDRGAKEVQEDQGVEELMDDELEMEQEPEIRTESEKQSVKESEDSVDSEPPHALVTRPEDEFEDFNIPVDDCIADPITQSPYNLEPVKKTKSDLPKSKKIHVANRYRNSQKEEEIKKEDDHKQGSEIQYQKHQSI